MIKVVLSSVINIISGGTPKTSVEDYWRDGKIGWLSVTDFNNDERYVYSSEKKITEKGLKESNTKLLRHGDIIISARGTVGALAQIGNPMCFNQSCFGIRGKKDKVDNNFLYYALKNYVQHIKKKSQGSVFDTINLKSFDLMEIEIPKSIIEQQKIAKVLSDLDAKIGLNSKINAALEAMAKTLYDYWFVQFDFPDANGKPYKSSGGKMDWNEELKREIPEGWEVKELEDILAEFTKGITTSYVEKSSLINLNQKVNKGFFLERQYFKYLDESIEIPKSKFAKKKDILINSLGQGTLGRIHYFIDNEKNIVVDQHLFILRAKSNISSAYLYNTLNSKAYQIQIERQITGSTGMQMLNASNIKDLKIIVPSFTISEKYEELVSKFYDKVSLNEKENQHLASLRDWLLPMLMNGQVRVGEVEALGMVAEDPVNYK